MYRKTESFLKKHTLSFSDTYSLNSYIENQWLSDCAIFPLDKFLKYNSFHICNYIF